MFRTSKVPMLRTYQVDKLNPESTDFEPRNVQLNPETPEIPQSPDYRKYQIRTVDKLIPWGTQLISWTRFEYQVETI